MDGDSGALLPQLEGPARFAAFVAMGLLTGAIITCISRLLFGRCILSSSGDECSDDPIQHGPSGDGSDAQQAQQAQQDSTRSNLASTASSLPSAMASKCEHLEGGETGKAGKHIAATPTLTACSPTHDHYFHEQFQEHSLHRRRSVAAAAVTAGAIKTRSRTAAASPVALWSKASVPRRSTDVVASHDSNATYLIPLFRSTRH
ncbi:hypothetical protein PTSG_04808 [Salpingoeca rosetta]|uniref:Uncharacterized protein n=1 Tax=Salpingoeca rosetta (strain ATCC 50818 / BSB-021) TaxID=946362 RepID=F2U9R8_SALR5|nr:uncharacterized protein PTSG_04808 [Salpingoeca rosetta]EGD73095.1 hypothetical protein PTSG_04808 [Salpingoeca rosetta]|eukprot:XP_004994126.1 hypothetical protein PTSG_04808 [Salpingoeca rosetta]